VNKNSGLNLSEIAREFQNNLKQYLPDFSSEFKEKLLPVGQGDIRKTVRKHLVNLLSMGRIRWIDGYYCPREAPDDEVSRELIELVDGTISGDIKPTNWRFPVADNAAIFRTYVNPPPLDPFRYDDFFGDQLRDFRDDLFFLDEILERAIGSGKLSPKFYNSTNGSLNIRMLRKGWASYFQDTKALVWMYAISPTYLRIFLETNFRRKYLKERLAANWDKILVRAQKRLIETRAMERRLKKIQALAKQPSENANAVKLSGAES
jgi:hypothetical protein